MQLLSINGQSFEDLTERIQRRHLMKFVPLGHINNDFPKLPEGEILVCKYDSRGKIYLARCEDLSDVRRIKGAPATYRFLEWYRVSQSYFS